MDTLVEDECIVAGGIVPPEPSLFLYDEVVKICPSGKPDIYHLCENLAEDTE